MKSTKFIDGVLPCMTLTDCPVFGRCGTNIDYLAPHTKKIICVCKHIETLSREIEKKDAQKRLNTIADYAYSLFWLLNSEIKETVKMAIKWREFESDKQTFLDMQNCLARCVKDYDLQFLSESLNAIKSCTD